MLGARNQGPATVSVAELSSYLQLNIRNVHAAYQAGKISKESKTAAGQFDLKLAVQSYVAQLRDTAAGRANESNGESSEALTELRKAQTRVAELRAEALAIDLAVIRRELLPAVELLDVWQRIISAARTRFMSLPARLPTRIHSMTKGDMAVVEDEVRSVLEKLVSDGQFAQADVASATRQKIKQATEKEPNE